MEWLQDQPKKAHRSRHKLLTSELFVVDGRIIQTAARLSTWRVAGPDKTRGGGIAFVKVEPMAAFIQENGGERICLPLQDPNRLALRGMIGLGVVLAGVVGFVLLRQHLRQRCD